MAIRFTRPGPVGDAPLRAAWDAVDAAVVVLEADGTVAYANRAARSALGWGDSSLDATRLDVTGLPTGDDGTASRVLVHGHPARCRQLGPEGRAGWVLQLVPDEASAARDPVVPGAAADQQLLVSQLQEAIRPPRPSLPEVELGVWYQAADAAQPTGGDLYDWYLLPDGDLHLLVVDVMGKGIAATKDALAVVHTIRTLVLEEVPLRTVVQRADELLTPAHPTLVATVLVARYRPATGRLVLADGGHPPTLIVKPDGETHEITAKGIPIGWPGAGSVDLVEVELGRSDTAIFYTDGLIEARRDILAGLRDLRAAAASTAGYPARDLPRILVERSLAGAERRDDAVALALRRRAAPATPARHLRLAPFEYRFAPAHAAVALARRSLADWLLHHGLDEREVADLCLAASELCANAVAAAVSLVVLRARADGDAVVVEVEDDGAGFRLPDRVDEQRPATGGVCGRGLFVASALIDDLWVERDETDRRTIVSARRGSLLPSTTAIDDGPSVLPPDRPAPTLGLDAAVSTEGARTRVALRGEIDSYSAPRLEALLDVGAARGQHLVVDLAQVSFIDSTGLDALVRELERARGDGAVISVRGATPATLMLFELTGFASLFDLQGATPP